MSRPKMLFISLSLVTLSCYCVYSASRVTPDLGLDADRPTHDFGKLRQRQAVETTF